MRTVELDPSPAVRAAIVEHVARNLDKYLVIRCNAMSGGLRCCRVEFALVGTGADDDAALNSLLAAVTAAE